MRTLLLLVGFGINICGQDFTVECDPSPVEAEEGKDATLSCKVSPSVNLKDQFVKWHVKEEEKRILYVWRSEQVNADGQDEQFKGRIRIDKEGLEKGNIVITISKIKPEDKGSYTCSVTIDVSTTKVSNVKLNVRNEGLVDENQARNTATTPGSTNAAVYCGPVLVILAILIIMIVIAHQRNPEAHAHNL